MSWTTCDVGHLAHMPGFAERFIEEHGATRPVLTERIDGFFAIVGGLRRADKGCLG